MHTSTVTSKPNAAIRVETYNLTEEEIKGLTINGRLSDIPFPNNDLHIIIVLCLYGVVFLLGAVFLLIGYFS